MTSPLHCVSALALWLSAGALACAATPQSSTALQVVVPDADADADVYVDGHYVGQVRALGADKPGAVQLAPGVHRVEVRKTGRFPVQRTVVVDGDSPYANRRRRRAP